MESRETRGAQTEDEKTGGASRVEGETVLIHTLLLLFIHS